MVAASDENYPTVRVTVDVAAMFPQASTAENVNVVVPTKPAAGWKVNEPSECTDTVPCNGADATDATNPAPAAPDKTPSAAVTFNVEFWGVP